MKLILQAIKSLLRKVYITIAEQGKSVAAAVATAESAVQKVDSKMDKENPTATGTFNVNGNGNNGKCAASIGMYSQAASDYSTAIGYRAETQNYGNLAIGSAVVAKGTGAIAIGSTVVVDGTDAIGIGNSLFVHGSNSIVMGMHNERDHENKYLFILGNGWGNKRSNAFTVDFDGNAWFAGTVESTGIILTSPNGTRYKVTVDDSGNLTAVTS